MNLTEMIATVGQIDWDYWLRALGDYWPHATVAALAAASAVFAYVRRPRSAAPDTGAGAHFAAAALLSPPLERPAYSDRMAYILAEMSALAYYRFEGGGGVFDQVFDAAARDALRRDLTDRRALREFLERFSAELASGRRTGLDSFTQVLRNSGYALLDVIDIQETQGFACRRDVQGDPPYLVLAFRGTEKKIADWLTDVRCVPTVQGKARVHTGFLEAFTSSADAEGRTVEDAVREILARPEARDEGGRPLPLFVTGHSLGGALALVATRRVAADVNGACYTFGAPRIGNYEYFRFVKTPVYRIVNSSDAVPRVPLGAGMCVLIHALRLMSWAAMPMPVVSRLFDRVEAFMDKLKGYRHHGDLRYLSDVAEGRFDTVRLLSNPPALDRLVWMWRHLARSLRLPFESHSIGIYRRKLAHIALDRN